MENLKIDLDKQIKQYNAKNPDLRPMTLLRLQAELGCTNRTLGEYRKKAPKSIQNLHKLSEIFGVSMEELLTE